MTVIKVAALVLSLIPGVVLGTSCSSSPTPGNNNSSPVAVSPKSPTSAGPQFELLNAWKPKKVTVEGYATGGEPAPKFTLTPKEGEAFVAVELMLKRDDASKPVPAALWSGTVLVDSAGKSHKFVFSYPSTWARYTPGGESVEYAEDQNVKSAGLIGKTLAETGNKLVVVFKAPPNESQFKLEIANGAPLQVSLKTK
jgi:hypothetical protein